MSPNLGSHLELFLDLDFVKGQKLGVYQSSEVIRMRVFTLERNRFLGASIVRYSVGGCNFQQVMKELLNTFDIRMPQVMMKES